MSSDQEGQTAKPPENVLPPTSENSVALPVNQPSGPGENTASVPPSFTSSGFVFGSTVGDAATTGGSAFGSGFGGTGGQAAGTAAPGGGLFGSQPATAQQNAFGGGGGGGGFGCTQGAAGGTCGSGFGQTTQPASGGLFGQPAQQPAGGGFGFGQASGGGFGFGGQQQAAGGNFGFGGQQAPPANNGGLFGGGGKAQKRDPRTLFFLVCGGEFVHGREKQCREQMNLIYNLIVEKGMAPEKHIMFVYGRGHKLNKKVKSFECTGPMFKLYGPSNQQQGFTFNPQPAGPKCPLPGPQDNAVVIFVGQGRYSKMMANSGGFFGAPAQESNLEDHFGDLLFVNNFSNATVYQATLKDLRAKNTLFICLADYSGESFQRAFDASRPDTSKKLYVVCLSESLHSSKDHCLASAFADFLDTEGWKERTIEDLVDVIQDKYSNHPSVAEKSEEIVKYTEEEYNGEVKETGAWATGNFSDLLPKTIPPYDWAMFDKVKELKRTVEEANVGELSSHMKEELEGFIDSMESLRIEAIKYNLHLPKPFEVIGDDEVCKIAWKDFLMTK